uniref:UmuC domain-containing protein n=1 Tax=Macrostomum lignano TaxID=282301 RepID=A0A1I8F468_9PLAT
EPAPPIADCADWLAARCAFSFDRKTRVAISTTTSSTSTPEPAAARRQRLSQLVQQQLPSIRIGALPSSADCTLRDVLSTTRQISSTIAERRALSRRHSGVGVGGHFMHARCAAAASVLWPSRGGRRVRVYAPESGESNEIVDRQVCCAYGVPAAGAPCPATRIAASCTHSPSNEQAAARCCLPATAASWSDALPRRPLIGAGCEANWVWETDWAVANLCRGHR